MKSFIVLAVLVAAALAGPISSDDRDAQIVKAVVDNIGVDGYSFGFETSNGIKQEEQAQLKNPGSENEAIEVRGQYSYTGNDGVVYAVTYIANELGFQPQGAHIPQAA